MPSLNSHRWTIWATIDKQIAKVFDRTRTHFDRIRQIADKLRQIATDSGQIAADRSNQPTINPNKPQNETELKSPSTYPGS
jgi:hypothetical protein